MWAAAGAVVAAGTIVALWPDSSAPRRPTPPAPVNNIAQNLRACLLTDGSPAGLEVWKALQDIASRSAINVQQETQPANTVGDSSYLNGLVQRRCALILVVGEGPTSVIDAVAKAHPEALFATNQYTGPTASNVLRLDMEHDTASAVNALVDKTRSRHS